MGDPQTLGVLVAPDVTGRPLERVTEAIERTLPEGWRLEVAHEALPEGLDIGETLDAVREKAQSMGADLAVALTDLPIVVDGELVVADADPDRGVALISIPALGATPGERAGKLVVALVELLVDPSRGADAALQVAPHGTRKADPGDAAGQVRLLAPGRRGSVRVVMGMVRANRPHRVMLGLSSAIAAAAATGAFAIITSDVWILGDALDPLRLSLLMIGAVLAMIAWLIVDHDLWERPDDDRGPRDVALFNAATLSTLTIGIVIGYVALFALNLVATLLVVDDQPLRETLQHDVGFAEYATVAWLATSASTVGGALGSGLESDQDVRAAAFGKRFRAGDEDEGEGEEDGS